MPRRKEEESAVGVLDQILDRTILFSFDRSGYLRHQRRYDPSDLDRSMTGRVCLVTGANSGLGLAVARGLAGRNATVHMLCRNAERGDAARQAILEQKSNSKVHLHVVDVSSLRSIRAFVERFGHTQVDVLIHNAGVLPLERELTDVGLELTVATHLVGPHLLNKLLLPRLRGARIVFVSSGGMYAKRLDMETMLSNEGPYDGVALYAMTKRGQVVLSEQWARELSHTDAVVNAMHPGWAATVSVERSLPRFWRIMRHRLRTPEEGADTVLWLVVAERVARETGKFWFDRRVVPTHLVRWTRETAEERQRLWDFCESSAVSE
jgi:NAD(P)-dependent dehydrogenase (short-subunit alcohol dehydrogenase family)